MLRPPIAQEHVTLTDDGLVAVQLKKPFRDGTVSVEMDPLSLVSRLAASVHPPRIHTVRHGGVLAPRQLSWEPWEGSQTLPRWAAAGKARLRPRAMEAIGGSATAARSGGR